MNFSSAEAVPSQAADALQDSQLAPAAPSAVLGVKTVASISVDKWGAILLLCAVGTVATLYLWFTFCKWLAGRGRMNSVAAGQLRLAAARGRIEDLVLLSRRPDFQVDADLCGFTALHAAAVQMHPGALVWLLKAGADLTRVKQDGWRDTALHYAAGSGSLECVQALLAWGADPCAENALGALPSDVAFKAGNHVLAGYLKAVAEAVSAAAAAAPAKGDSTPDGSTGKPVSEAADTCQGVGCGAGSPTDIDSAGHNEKHWVKASDQAGGRLGSHNIPSKEELIHLHLPDASKREDTLCRSNSRGRSLAAMEAGEGGGGKAAAGAATAANGGLQGATVADAGPVRIVVSSMGDGAEQRSTHGGAAVSKARTAASLQQLSERGFEGWGTQGTVPRPETRLFRPLAILTQVLGGSYLVWRALRTLRPGYFYFYSIPFWLAEFAAYCLSYCFITSLYYMIERPERRVHEMLPAPQLPHVDVYICTYSEPPEIVEPTAIAALNMNWPGSKLTVHILDDSKRPVMARMARNLTQQCEYMQREVNIVYVAREKVKGVPHHAKAGNINSCLLKEGPGKGEYILVLDCDMIVHPDFLERTIGHFYRPASAQASPTPVQPQPPAQQRWWRHWQGRAAAAPCAADERAPKQPDWVPKDKAAFLQTPQDFWNVDAADPMVHCARFFYGPMLQGRDGIGAAPCCGTGVVFRRDILVSIGGQAYGSITEDYNTAMTLMSAGMATMYLNERLSFGMAPDHIADVLQQRLRWAMGALQILMKDNPLRLVGLTVPQALLFFEAAAHHWLAVPTIMMALVPIIFLFTQVSPMVCSHMWEFTAFFGTWYLANRVMMLYLHKGTEGGSQELWRGSQMWVWMAPNHLQAIWKVLVSENALVKRLFKFEIGFKVTDKDKERESQWEAAKKALQVTWPHLLYCVAFLAGTIYFVVQVAMGAYSSWQVMVFLSAIAWGLLILLCIWPLIYTLMPRVETEAGWKIVWDPFLNPTPEEAHADSTSHAPQFDPRSSTSMPACQGTGGVNHPGYFRASLEQFSHYLRGTPSAIPKEEAEQGDPASSMESGKSDGTALAAQSAFFAPAQHSREEQPLPVSPASPTTFFTPPQQPPQQQPLHVSPASAGAHVHSVAPAPGLRWSLERPPFAPAAGSGHLGILPEHVLVEAGSVQFSDSAGASAPQRPSRLSNVGRVAMHSRVNAMLDSSALITGMVLPERSPTAPNSVSVMLDAWGHMAPTGAAGAASARQQSHPLASALQTGGHLAGGRQSVDLSRDQSLALQRLNTLTGDDVEQLPGGIPTGDQQQRASLHLPSRLSIGHRHGPGLPSRFSGLRMGGEAATTEAGRRASLCFSPRELPSIAEVRLSGRHRHGHQPQHHSRHSTQLDHQGHGSSKQAFGKAVGSFERAAPVRPSIDMRGLTPFASAAYGRFSEEQEEEQECPGGTEAQPDRGGHGKRVSQAGYAAVQAGAESTAQCAAGSEDSGGAGEGHSSRRSSSAGSHSTWGSSTSSASLVFQMADEAGMNLKAERGEEDAAPAPGAAPDRVARLSCQLVRIAASLSTGNASMLLDQGYSLVVPVQPASIYEHTLMARPNFREREGPGSSYMFLLVNSCLLACLVVGSVLDARMNTSQSDIGSALGLS